MRKILPSIDGLTGSEVNMSPLQLCEISLYYTPYYSFPASIRKMDHNQTCLTYRQLGKDNAICYCL